MSGETAPRSKPDAPRPAGPAPADGEPLAEALRGFGPLGILAMVVIFLGNSLFVPLSALLVLVWARWSRTPWRDLGYVRPKNWIATVAVGVIFGAGFKLLMKAVVMPLLGAPPVNAAYHYLAGNTAALPFALYATTIGAGFGEETMFRGYLFERLGRLFGPGAAAKTGIVLFTSAWFGLDHYAMQGLPGAEQAAVMGLLFGFIRLRTGGIAMLMIAHAAFDVTAVAIIYWNLESAVAHLILG